jgi:hypothetical protein
MCDRCGTVFSERAENWTTFTGSTRRKNPEGQWVTVSDTLDQCPECTEVTMVPQRPELTTRVSDVRQPTVSPHYEPGT